MCSTPVRQAIAALALCCAPAAVEAQDPATAAGECARLPEVAAPIRLLARVHAAELRVAVQPLASISDVACPPHDTIRVLLRRNLPEPVEPGVTYRDVEIVFEFRTHLAVLCTPLLRRLIEGGVQDGAVSDGAAYLMRACAADPLIERSP
jgi:hypothetical protein